MKPKIKMEATPVQDDQQVDLKAILSQMQEQSKLLAQQQMMIEELKSGNKPKRNIHTGNPKYRLRVIDGKVVTNFLMLRNEVKRNLVTGGYLENQECEVTYADGSKEKMLYADWVNAYKFTQPIEAKSVKDMASVRFKDETEKVIPLMEFKSKYYIRVKGITDPVINHEIVDTVEYSSEYEFENPKLNEGKAFTVDHTIIN